jgi:hypothetical protein
MSRKLKFDLTVEPNALLCPNPSEFYSKAYITEDVVDNYRPIPGIKSATKIANVLFDNVLKASTCNFSAEGQTLDAIDIDVCALSAMAELCRFDLEASFVSLQMAKGSNGSFEVPAFMAYYWDEMAKEIAQEIAVLRWQGNKEGDTDTFLDLCDGYEVKFNADETILRPDDEVVITSANVLAEMAKTYATLPGKVRADKANLRFYIASNVYASYQLAAAAGNTQTYVTQSLGDTFLGIKIVIIDGASDNTMVLTNKANLIYAFDGEGDAKALKAVNLEDSVAEPLLRTRANIKVGFFYSNPTEIVFYQPAA